MPAEEMVTVLLGSAGQRGHGDVPVAERQVLVDLIGDDHGVVPGGKFDDALKHLAGEHRAGGVVRIVDQHHLGAAAEGRFQGRHVRHEVRSEQWRRHVRGAGQSDHGAVGVVERFEGEHFVAGFHERQQRSRNGFGGAGGDDDLCLRVRRQAVEPLLVRRNGLAQGQDSLARCVLVGAGGDGGLRGRLDLRRAVLVRETLSQVDGTGPDREGGHLLEDRDAEGAVGCQQVGS